ncbi:MAG: CzcE family metal-binding protein [Noviherbaspirillum sp.]
MNPKLIFPTIFAGVLSAACASLGSPPRPDLLGDPAPVAAATRTIVITPSTKYVNVTGGEIVTFVVGDKAFAWSFNGTRYAPFDLSMTAPPGVLDHRVLAYVAPDPRYIGAGSHAGYGSRGGK